MVLGLWGNWAGGAVRDGDAISRTKSGTSTQQRVSTTTKSNRSTTVRSTVLGKTTTARGATTQNSNTQSRASVSRAATSDVVKREAANINATTPTRNTISRATTPASARTTKPTIVSRAATATQTSIETRTGAEYEQCKTAYFTCMDQFCQYKNDDYRRCSCSNRVNDLVATRTTLQEAGEQITVFTENLDAVGMTAAQATAMRTASEGENALTADTSASKALLQAIMNSIRGGDTNVGGKYSDLNSINISFDATNAFGALDAGQAIATYNGQNLYSAVYPQCRDAVKADCNDASLQRAINAYLMAIEQDCNTVQTAIESTQKQMKAAVREGSAMLDLARVENRRAHNSDDIATCMNNVEKAILSEEVCGAGYHRCLDNGQFINVDTGAPITGVAKFYELGKLLTFNDSRDVADQNLSKIPNNRTFVQNFENRTKKFAQPALDKCVEEADVVWEEYLDKAMLSIYYAQQSKVSEIKQGCFDFISTCYMNGDSALTAAMKSLSSDSSVVLQPDKVVLTGQMCTDYVESCNNMFDNDIIAQYINSREDTDTLTACRAVAKQCFDKFGGTSYENFYYPYSGLFTTGRAADWFTLYEYESADDAGNPIHTGKLVSECAKQLANIDACSSPEMLKQAFGGFDVAPTNEQISTKGNLYSFDAGGKRRYGLFAVADKDTTFLHRTLRPTGVATEIYNQIADILTTQCLNMQGRFVELQNMKPQLYDANNLCISQFKDSLSYDGVTESNKNPTIMSSGTSGNLSEPISLVKLYGIGDGENMCPRDYAMTVDTQSWGACLCWENGGRRSKNGKSAKCQTIIPVDTDAKDSSCYNINGDIAYTTTTVDSTTSSDNWCTQSVLSSSMQVCPLTGKTDDKGNCVIIRAQDGTNVELPIDQLPEAIIR